MNTSLRALGLEMLSTRALRTATTRILVVSQDESTGAILANNLQAPAFEVETAVGGPEALTRIRQWPPDVIVVDTTTPDLSSWDFQACRAEGANGARPIVALSTLDQLSEVVSREGVWVCMVKPVEVAVLVGAVERIANFCSSG